jgi:NADPH:quinone reductase-like Zn-dependent oxidoreductase
LDWHTLTGTPYVVRTQGGLRRPRTGRLGVDFAGVVTEVGSGVTDFHPGDEVFGARSGALAEHVCIAADRAVAPKPSGLTFEEAAAVPVAALTALQGLRDKGRVAPGHRVLVNGASGGVGTFAVQVAKSFGADVTGVWACPSPRVAERIGDVGNLVAAVDDGRHRSRGEQFAESHEVGLVHLRQEERHLVAAAERRRPHPEHVTQRSDHPVPLRASDDDDCATRLEHAFAG